MISRAVVLIAALSLATFGVLRGTWAAGGSDSSCYALMADAFARGELQPSLPLASRAPWPNAITTFTPAGFIPSPVRPGTASPVCTPGFSLFLAPFRWIGIDAIFFVTPVAAAMLVWCVFVVARSLGGDSAGACAAVVVASTPIVLFQAVQPMNDILTTTLWIVAFAAATIAEPRRSMLMGIAAGAAILVRPNLAPIALPLVFLAAPWRVAVWALPGVAIAAALNTVLYGAPWRLGYGEAGQLFSVANIAVNAQHYTRAWVETATPFAALALAAPFALRREKRPLSIALLASAGMCIAIYLAYRPFDEWWYLCFLLPALVLTTTLAAAVAAELTRSRVVVALVAAALVAYGLYTARERQAFDLVRLEARFRDSARAVRDKLPANALLITVWQSGTVRFHAQRDSLLWDSLEPRALDEAVAWLQAQGYEPFLLLERWEEALFRERFAGASSLGALDWPPRLDIDRQVRVFAPGDRVAYLAGTPVPTEYVLPAKR